MPSSEMHEMELLGSDEEGTEEWHCPICGRRFLMNWPPDYKRTIIFPGDEYVTHVGGKGGVRMGAPSVLDAEVYLPTPEPETARASEPPLDGDVSAFWRRALAQIEADDHGEGERS